MDDFLSRKLGREDANATPLGLKYRAALSGAMGAAATGHPGAGIPIAALQSAASSTRGQLGLAKLGKMVGPSLAPAGDAIANVAGGATQAALPAATQAAVQPPDPATVRAQLQTLPIQQRAKALTLYNKTGQLPPSMQKPPPPPQGPPTVSSMAQRLRQQPFGAQ